MRWHVYDTMIDTHIVYLLYIKHNRTCRSNVIKYAKIKKMRIFIKKEQRYLSDVYDEEVRKKDQDGADGVLYSAKEKGRRVD